MLTIQHSESLAVWAFRTGVRNYLVKPVKVESIVEEINRLATQLKPRVTNRPLKNVFEAADARQKQAKKRSLCMINEHFEPVFNTAAAMQIVFQRPAKPRINLLKRYPIPKEFHFISASLLSQRTISAINYVETHFQEKITEQEVAPICGMSVFTFSRIFRNEHSITFREFLIKHRIMRAKEFLQNPKIAIIDVAQLSGFTDTSNFARLFRRYIGMAPSYYQKKHTE